MSPQMLLFSHSVQQVGLTILSKEKGQKSSMGGKAHQNATDSPKVEIGEIDTRAPFESVKAAVSLFGEGAVAANKTIMKKTKSMPAEVYLLSRLKP